MRPSPLLPKAGLALLALLLASTGLAADPEPARPLDWPQWRGPHRDGQVTDGPPWPKSLTETQLRSRWRVPLGPSYSGPLVVGNRVFTTETRDRKTEVVRALDRTSGAELWKAEWPGTLSVPFFAKANGDWIRATPACDGERLYVAGIRDVLVALDVETGAEVWRVDFVAEDKTPVPPFGFVSSPLVTADALFVQAGGATRRLDPQTGKTLWTALKDGGGMNKSAFSSPVLATLAGREQLIVQTRETLAGLDPATGDELWSQSIAAFRGMNILTPTVIGDTLFTSAYGGKSLLFKVSAEGSRFSVAELWTNKTQGYMSSPVIIQGHAYLHLRNQRFTCIDLETGKERWVTTPFGKYWSLVARGDHILALDERGDLLLIHASPEKFDLLDTRHVHDSSTWAHLAVCGTEVFVRDLEGLTAFQWQTATPAH